MDHDDTRRVLDRPGTQHRRIEDGEERGVDAHRTSEDGDDRKREERLTPNLPYRRSEVVPHPASMLPRRIRLVFPFGIFPSKDGLNLCLSSRSGIFLAPFSEFTRNTERR